MKKNFTILLLASITILTSCSQEEEVQEFNTQDTNLEMVKERIKAYSPTEITADISDLTVNQKKVVENLVRAGKVSDEIFWMQNTPDAISVRDSLANSDSESSDIYLEYVKINYGPYDEIYVGERFVGDGPSIRPPGGNFYPADLSKEDFENYVSENPEVESDFTSLYTVIKDEDSVLKAVPYHEAYDDKVE